MAAQCEWTDKQLREFAMHYRRLADVHTGRVSRLLGWSTGLENRLAVQPPASPRERDELVGEIIRARQARERSTWLEAFCTLYAVLAELEVNRREENGEPDAVDANRGRWIILEREWDRVERTLRELSGHTISAADISLPVRPDVRMRGAKSDAAVVSE